MRHDTREPMFDILHSKYSPDAKFPVWIPNRDESGMMCFVNCFLTRNEFAYASSDKLVYIRRFSDRGADMTLSAVLQGHEAEVTQVSHW